ncbi:MAG TPA: MMPL family transporter [Candidatus Binatia bacterium]|nr:MMPL family transporter [Candidatus Binatia bacterium]
MLATWGRLVHRFRWAVVAAAALSSIASLAVIRHGAHFDNRLVPAGTESGRALDLIQAELPGRALSFSLVFGHPTMAATDPGFRAEVERALAPLRTDERVAAVRTAYDATPPDASRFGRDGRHTLVDVELHGMAPPVESVLYTSGAAAAYPELRARVRSDLLTVLPAGMVALSHEFYDRARRDVIAAELVILPIVPVLLLLVFGSVVAAALPFGVGLLAVAGGVAATYLLSHATSVSIYAGNVVTMIGLAVAIDYSLFIVSRFREEIRTHAVPEALARTLATAGQAVLFSGLTVAIGLLGLAFLGLGNLGTLGLAGTAVVGFSVVYALTLLPALLALLGPRVDMWRIPGIATAGPAVTRGFWYRLAALVMAHPWKVLVPVAVGMLLLGSPFARIRLGSSDVGSLPPSAPARQGEALVRSQFPGGDVNRIPIVLEYAHGAPLGAERIDAMYDLSRWIASLPGVISVSSPVDLDASITREQYRQLAGAPHEMVPAPIREALRQLTGPHIALLVVHSSLPAGSDAARALVQEIRRSHPRIDGQLLVTGHTAFDVDFIALVRANAPRAVALIVLATYVVLFLLLGSVVLPIKAVLMNFLSISASYGALVWIFQDGHLSRWLNFTPGPIETATPLIMFCVIFGLSMDYGVLLLSRIREEYQRTGDNALAVGAGLERTGRLITAAAAIMAAVFFGFARADLVVVKAVGIGMGIAVVLDATVVRALLVPAAMRLLGDWNWWAPRPLARLQERLGLG